MVESGVVDDWSVLRSASVLADTGRIQYNGWEAPMLGWILYLGAAAIKLFGVSFTAVRSLSVLVGLLTIIIFQRILARSGVQARDSVIGVLTCALSPIFLIGSVLFISDLPAVLAVMVCLYACIRALQASTERAAAGWVCFAALSNAVLGTTRQTAWLGLLVMVPSTLWLLRRRQRVLVAGAIACAVGLILMGAALRWFSHQPYVLPERLLPGPLRMRSLSIALHAITRIGLDLVLLTFPAASAYLACIRGLNRKRAAYAIILAAGWLLVAYGPARTQHLLAPFLLFPPHGYQTAENTFISFMMPIMGPSPSQLALWFRLLLTALAAVGAFALLAGMLRTRTLAASDPAADRQLPWPQLLVLVVPFSLAYLLLLMPRAIFIFTVDRYLLPLLPFAVLLQLRFFERLEGRGVTSLTALPLVVFGLYSVLTLHDTFAIYRADMAGVDELRAAGIPRNSINGGFEYNALSQVLADGYAHAAGIRLPSGSILQPSPTGLHGDCVPPATDMTPAVHARYGLAYDGAPCPRVAGFAPVRFRTWLPPFTRTAYVVQTTSTQ